ncbi:hypothetical protein JCM3766R1_001891 [Sporobolomyces carnicolor]
MLGLHPALGLFLVLIASCTGAHRPLAPRSVVPLTRRDTGLVRRDGSVDLGILSAEMGRLAGKYFAVANHTLARRDPAFKLRKRANPQSLSYEGDSLWTGPIYVGTPPQEFRVYYDTASSDLSLASTTCLDASCSGKARYDWEASATANATIFTVESNWVEGDTGSGRLIRDTVTIGTSTVVNQDVVAQQAIGLWVSTRHADGVGLAYPDASAARSASFPFSLFRQKDAGTFSMRLSRFPGASKVFFEGLDRSIAASAPVFFPVAKDPDEQFRTYWQIGQSTAFFNGSQAYSGRVNFILDSGSSIIIAPPDAAAEFWTAIPGFREEINGYYSYPCDQPVSVDLSFGGSEQFFAIDSGAFNLGSLEGDSTRCLGALAGNNMNLWDSWIIGSPFFENWLLTFAGPLFSIALSLL